MWSKTWSKYHTRSPDGQHAWTLCVHTILSCFSSGTHSPDTSKGHPHLCMMTFSTLSDPQMLKEMMIKYLVFQICIYRIDNSHILPMLSAKMRPQSIGRWTELAADVTTEPRGGSVLRLDMVIN